MEHSKNFESVKRYYNLKVWDDRRVKNAVKMGWITESEYQEITGKSYVE